LLKARIIKQASSNTNQSFFEQAEYTKLIQKLLMLCSLPIAQQQQQQQSHILPQELNTMMTHNMV
jgi:hypothetical protein